MATQFRKDDPNIPVQGTEVLLAYHESPDIDKAVVLFADNTSACLIVHDSYRSKRLYYADLDGTGCKSHGLKQEYLTYIAHSICDCIQVSPFLLQNVLNSNFIGTHLTRLRGSRPATVKLADNLLVTKGAYAIECPTCHGYAARRKLTQDEMSKQACGKDTECCVAAFDCKVCHKVVYTSIVRDLIQEQIDEE